MAKQDLPTNKTVHTENVAFNDQLMRYRGGIDAIDKQLLALLNERMHIVRQVGALKAQHNLTGSYIRPGREATMVRELLKNTGDFPPQALAAIWRIIIGSSTAIESPLNVVSLHDDDCAQMLATSYFGATVPHQSMSCAQLLATLQQDVHAVAVLPYHADARLWAELPSGVKVFACLPFVSTHEPRHLLCGAVTPEATGDDITLTFTKGKLVKHDGFNPQLAGFIGAYAREVRL